MRPRLARGGTGGRFEGGGQVMAVHVGRPRAVRIDALELQPRGVRAVGVERGGLRAVRHVDALGVPPLQDEQFASRPELPDQQPAGGARRQGRVQRLGGRRKGRPGFGQRRLRLPGAAQGRARGGHLGQGRVTGTLGRVRTSRLHQRRVLLGRAEW